MKNIGVVVDNELYGDARVINECKILQDNGFKVFVLCFNFGRYESNEILFGLNVSRISISQKNRNILFAFNNTFEFYNLFWKRQIKKFIQKYSIDNLHVHDLYMSKAAYYATKNTNIDFTLDLHENYPAAVKGYKWMYQFPLRYLIRPAKWKKNEGKYLSYPKNIIVLSETFRNDLLIKYSFLKKDQFAIYPNVPDLKEFNNYTIDKNILDKADDFLLFYFGVISERRGIYTVIEALKKLHKSYNKIKLLLIGPVDKIEKKLFNETISNPEINDRIIHYSWKDISLLPSYISVSDICLSPIVKNAQHESGVANKIFQYMLFEKGLIVSDCKPQAKIINDENCGLVFKSGDSIDLAEKIEILYKNKRLRKEMGIKGKIAVEEKYNIQIAGKNLLNLYS
ncbi:MAG: glycosyltransferase family 4 protein [Bacteroidales bacterium]|jgi:glycosyltransferase involved in cell wall biosynthesis|nr:glycosyltransferase family 4 protein [Bacteroidales bacterium]